MADFWIFFLKSYHQLITRLPMWVIPEKNNNTFPLFLRHSVKSVRIWSFSSPYFPAFGLNTRLNWLNSDWLRISPYSVRNSSYNVCTGVFADITGVFLRFSVLKNAYESFALREKCLYLEIFWSAFSHIRTEYGEMRGISPYSVRMRENADQKNSKYRHFSRSVNDP